MTLCRRDCYVSSHCKNSQWWPDYTIYIAEDGDIKNYRIGLIKRPGVYFLAHLSEGAFKRDGRLFKDGRLLFKIITCMGVYLIKHMHTHMAHVHRAHMFIVHAHSLPRL